MKITDADEAEIHLLDRMNKISEIVDRKMRESPFFARAVFSDR